MQFDNNNIYSGLNDPKIENDFRRVQTNEETLKRQVNQLTSADDMAQWLNAYDGDLITLMDIATFAALIRVVDSANEQAEQLEAKANQAIAELEQVAEPLYDHLMQLTDVDFNALVQSEALAPFHFKLQHKRAMAVHRLSVAEETLLQKMAVDGLHAWGEQYSKLAGTLRCDIDGETVGLASAFNMTMSADRTLREAAFNGIRSAWAEHQDSVVAGLNAINGWRLNEFQRRSGKQELHYLDVACHQSHITRDTLHALMNTADEQKSVGQKAIRLMQQWNDIADGKPWDLMAPPKSDGTSEAEPIPYEEALDIIQGAFAEFDPDMANFVQRMHEHGWIDAKPTPNRATGAFCTEFFAAGEPRVFMTYDGSMGNVLTLAHELGHAWHAWVMRDIPFSAKQYPMTLAETASIFAETLVRQALLQRAGTDQLKRDILWQEAESAAALLINIPARFEFEKNFVEARKNGKVSANKARSLMSDAWATWYEDSISEYDDMFWASKLHFSIAEIGFYNYPYLFGYLFALGVYAQKDKQGENFRLAYRALLQDTGRMTAEQCVEKHLQRDIRDADFWRDSFAIVDNAMEAFAKVI